VSVNTGRTDGFINEQIFALKLITKKLESAHKGQNVEWPSISGESSDAGSRIDFELMTPVQVANLQVSNLTYSLVLNFFVETDS
jgi:hypothetical protein